MRSQKFFSLLLVVVLVFELFPIQAFATSELLHQVLSLPPHARPAFKSSEIASHFPSPVSFKSSDGNDISIENVSVKDSHLELFVRAWNGKKQYGFGKTGSVETERLRVYNPPIMVPDGTKTTKEDPHGKEYQVDNFKTDPEAALKAVVEDMVRVTGKLDTKITKGSIGRTVSVLYPTLNGTPFRLIPGGSEEFNVIRSGAGNDHDDTADEDQTVALSAGSASGFYHYSIRMFYIFDTSVIGGTQEISDATFSAYGTYRNTGLAGAINLVAAQPASDYAIADSDYAIGNFGSTSYASSVNFSAVNASGYEDFTLNSTGRTAIDHNGNTYLGLLTSFDFNNSAPTWCANCYSAWGTRWIASGGTTQDPKFTITHTGLPTQPETSIQNLSYEYDQNGNITKIIDSSGTDTAKTTEYTYDDLNRLLTASTTGASGGDFYHQYSYDPIGNITSSTSAGVYEYGGGAWVNPHAVTKVASTSYIYDLNGNLKSNTTWIHEWDYRNRLIHSTGTSTLSYAYDHNNMRVQLSTFSGGATSTTLIPFAGYSLEDGTPVKYITANGQLIATIRGSGASSTTYFIHTDHLGSTEKTTDASGTIAELTDYYPFGSERQHTGSLSDSKGFLGKDSDTDTGLSQLEARYYKGDMGRFISQDPVFWEVGLTKDGKSVLANPQQMNSYSYAANNPITRKDPTGRLDSQALLSATLGQLISILGQYYALLGLSNALSVATPVASSLMNHSLSIDPKPLTITPKNQSNYGGAIDKIQKSDEFNNYIKKKIEENEKSGKVNVELKPQNSFAFESGDLFFAFHNVNAGFSGSKLEDGSWDLKVNMSDLYDFVYKGEKANPSLPANIANNWAYLGQQSGVITKYGVYTNFDYHYIPY